MSNLAITLLRDPSAIVELFAALFAAAYLLQLLLQQRNEIAQVVETRPLGVRNAEPQLFGPEMFGSQLFGSGLFGLGLFGFGGRKTVAAKRRQAASALNSASQPVSTSFGRLSTRQDVENFHRAIFHDLSDSGSLFPAKQRREAVRKNDLRLYGVGSYVSSNKRSLRKSSAQRLRLPE